ncbi:hypothetical protein [Gilvibacter sp.]|uniref:hypothetical protein n=1 Tax=Gilvibacter sp. TaxID=2729997 RepID=UPI003B52D6D1
MGHYREAFTHGYSVQQVSPFFVSGVVQGMMLMLEEQLRYSGMEPEMYWESERGKQLCKNLSDFKEYCRMYWLRQPQYVEELN